MTVICVGGVAGVGKSTVIREALDRIEQKGYHVYSVGSFMFEEAERRGVVADRDQMRFLDEEVQDELKAYAVEELERRVEAGENIILDSHYVIPTPDGYLPGLPPEDLDRIGVDAYVLLTADPEMIATRRTSDTSRDRDKDPLDEISRDQYHEVMAACEVADRTGAPLYTIDTTRNDPGAYGDRLVELVHEVEERGYRDGPAPGYALC